MRNTMPPGAATRRLHHYTSRDRLGSIAARGLAFGEVPLTPRKVVQGVWLTDDTDPAGHGLDAAKREVRVTVELDAADAGLHHWPAWGLRHLRRGWYRTLDRVGGGKSARWWVYFGVIPPERVVEVVDLRRGVEPVADWRAIPADPLVERLVTMQQAVAAPSGATPAPLGKKPRFRDAEVVGPAWLMLAWGERVNRRPRRVEPPNRGDLYAFDIDVGSTAEQIDDLGRAMLRHGKAVAVEPGAAPDGAFEHAMGADLRTGFAIQRRLEAERFSFVFVVVGARMHILAWTNDAEAGLRLAAATRCDALLVRELDGSTTVHSPGAPSVARH